VPAFFVGASGGDRRAERLAAPLDSPTGTFHRGAALILAMLHPHRAALVLCCLAMAGPLAATTYDEARALYQARRYAEARTAFEGVAAAEPTNAGAAYHLGVLALMRDAPEEAVPWLEKATTLAPTSSRYLVSLGDAYGLAAQKAGLFSKPGLARKCRAAYEKAVALDPRNVDAHYALFRFYRQAPAIVGGGLEKAREEARQLQQLDDLRGTLAMVEVSVAEKSYETAFAQLAALRRRHPDSATAAFQIGRLAALSGQRLSLGATMLKEYLSHTPDEEEPPLWAAHWRLGIIYEKMGDAAGARAEYQAGLKLNPTQPQLVEALHRVQ
jgi:tetratricopeptide (TPR) repeat protein